MCRPVWKREKCSRERVSSLDAERNDVFLKLKLRSKQKGAAATMARIMNYGELVAQESSFIIYEKCGMKLI